MMKRSKLAPRSSFLVMLSLSVSLGLGCDSCEDPPPVRITPATETQPTENSRPANPAIVVAVVFDQLGSNSLLRLLPHLSPDGALRRTARQGVFYEVSTFPYAGTYTAAGHATIFTGAVPAVHGIATNRVWNCEHQRVDPSCADPESPVLGHPEETASLRGLRVETVADALRRAHGTEAKIASISIKDRATIFGGGRQPDVALWYVHDIPAFTTSRSFGSELPAWLPEWTRQNPLSELLVPWTVEDGEALQTLLGPDDAPGEDDWSGLSTTFPHDPNATERPYSTLRATPQLGEYTIQLAEQAAQQLAMGTDEIPDLLAISISSTDYVGHMFGPHSWEYFDNLRRVDRALGAMLERLSSRAPIGVLITSDHGAPELPERLNARSPGSAGRFDPRSFARELDRVAVEHFGPGKWVDYYEAPFVYLSIDAREGEHREELIALLIETITARPEMSAAFDVQEVLSWESPADPLHQLVRNSTHPDTLGDVFVVYEENFFHGSREHGLTHGSPHDYDREVPLLFSRPGMQPSRRSEPTNQLRVAPTLSWLLDIEPPRAAEHQPITE